MGRRELPQEIFAPVVQRETYLSPKSLAACHPSDFMLLQESIAPVLPFLLFLSLLQSLKQRQLLLSFVFESLLAKLEDLARTCAEDLSERLERSESSVLGRCHEPAVPYLDYIVDLLFAEFLHFL